MDAQSLLWIYAMLGGGKMYELAVKSTGLGLLADARRRELSEAERQLFH